MPLRSIKRQVSDAENKLRLLCCVEALGGITQAQLWPFVASLELMDYMPMQLLLHELIADGDVEKGALALEEQLFLTEQGRRSLRLFDGRIMASDRQEIRRAAALYRAQLQRKAGVQAVYESAKAGEYRVRLSLQEGEIPLLTLRLHTPDRDWAAAALHGFGRHAADLLAYIYSLEMEEGPPEVPGQSQEVEPHRLSPPQVQSHGPHEHTVSAQLPHEAATLSLSLLLPDAHAAEAYQRMLANPTRARDIAQRFVDLLQGADKD